MIWIGVFRVCKGFVKFECYIFDNGCGYKLWWFLCVFVKGGLFLILILKWLFLVVVVMFRYVSLEVVWIFWVSCGGLCCVLGGVVRVVYYCFFCGDILVLFGGWMNLFWVFFFWFCLFILFFFKVRVFVYCFLEGKEK